MEPNALTAIRYEYADGVATVTLDRPDKLNAYTHATCAEMSSVWQHVRNDASVRAVVLTASGDRAFCTGVDRNEIEVGNGGEAYNPYTYVDEPLMLGPRWNECWKPVVAAVNGMACGGAFYMLGESDIIIAAEHATFFDPHVTYGMPSIYEPTLMLARMPFGEVVRMTLLGTHERISAARALEIGLVSEVVPGTELLAVAHQVAADIASQPPAAVQASLRALWAARELSRRQMLDLGATFLNLGTTEDAMAAGQSKFQSGQRIVPRVR